MRSWARRWIAIVAAVPVAGCGPTAPQGQSLAEPNHDEEIVTWPFWPTRLRIHPLTRVARAESDDLVIEARVEFFDGDDDTTKAVGRIRLDLHAAGRPPDPTSPLASWSHDLRDLTVNRRHFDDVTRTYLFRLEIEPEQVEDRVDLYAYFLSANGQPLPPAEPHRLRHR